MLVAMLKVTVSEESIKKMGLKKVKIHEIYLGRWIIFLILGLLQSTLIALGDLYYLGIQCAHTFLFLFGCWFSSIVYVTISYTLTVSFGDIGKAGSVVLLVMQVAGTGGTFPIECAPKFFRAVSASAVYAQYGSPAGSGWRLLWERLLDRSGKTGHLPGDCTFCRTCTSQTDHSDERSVYRAAGGNKNNLSRK